MKSLSVFLTESSEDSIFTIVKPGFLNLIQTIIEIMAEHGFEIDKMKTKRLLLSEAQSLYDIHKDEDWYDDLCEYMSSGPTTAIIFKHPAITDIFDKVGKIKDEIRNEYGESDMRNVMHSSDSLEHMKHESSIYFNEV